MLTRLMFGGGGTAQVLIMQAGRNKSTYGYAASAYGSLSPNFIYHQGVTYEINSFVTKVEGGYYWAHLFILQGQQITKR